MTAITPCSGLEVQLPSEIIDSIIDHLCDDSLSLAVCALTSRHWVTRAHFHLFEHVQFGNEARVDAFLRLKTATTSFINPSNIRIVTIASPLPFVVAKDLENLEELRLSSWSILCDIAVPTSTTHSSLSSNAFRSLRLLSLTGVTIRSHAVFYGVLIEFPSLRYLELKSFVCASPPLPIPHDSNTGESLPTPQFPHPPLLWTSLSVLDSGFIFDFMRWMIIRDVCPAFACIHLLADLFRPSNFIANAMVRWVGSLECVSMTANLNLSAARNLKHIHMPQVRLRTPIFNQYCDALERITSRHIETLSFQCFFSPCVSKDQAPDETDVSAVVRSVDWAKLDHVLCTVPAFENLQRVDFYLADLTDYGWEEEEETDIASMLPGLKARNVELVPSREQGDYRCSRARTICARERYNTAPDDALYEDGE